MSNFCALQCVESIFTELSFFAHIGTGKGELIVVAHLRVQSQIDSSKLPFIGISKKKRLQILNLILRLIIVFG